MRAIALTLAACLTATMTTVLAAPAASAEGPSVPVPVVRSTPVSQARMEPRAADPATNQATRGNQPTDGGGATDGGGTATASPLSPSATWEVAEHTGDFTWSYPLRMPPAPGGRPSLALAYRSSTVDGRTSATNNQASWVGDGWSLEPGFIERAYGGCTTDTEGSAQPKDTGDLCWKTNNAVASFDGAGGQLIEESGNTWRAESDTGARVERVLGADNKAHDGEHWKVTTVDGTQYFFGSRAAAGSTWLVPVVGDDTDEPCHSSAGFHASRCDQAWRWNLDKVVDPNGHTTLYTYAPETNRYEVYKKDVAVPYTRGGHLKLIEYGMREGGQPVGRVEFEVVDRCVKESECFKDGKPRAENWPDVPWSQECVDTRCKDRYSPTFWTTKRLSKVRTSVRAGSGWDPIDTWALGHEFPRPGSGEDAPLWLRSITHTGHIGAGQDQSEPSVVFEGTALPNRVIAVPGLSPLNRYRVTGIVSEAGGVLTVDYHKPDCAAAPAKPEENTLRCFPATWTKKDFADREDWFHKYAVERIVQSDRLPGSAQQETRYEYLDGAAWHFDTSEFVKQTAKTWSEFRGYGLVRRYEGVAGDEGGPVTMTESRFFRGMHGDRRRKEGGTKEVSVPDSEGGSVEDSDWLLGFTRESATYSDATTVVAKKIMTPWAKGPSATRGDLQSYLVRPGTTRSYTALVSGGWRVTESKTDYDDRGLSVRTDDLGDISTASDDQCTRTTYRPNAQAWMLSYPARTESVAVRCDATPKFPEHAIADARTAYDGQGFDVPPTRGNATSTQVLAERPASGPIYAPATRTEYDEHGRPVKKVDELGRETRTAYTPPTGGPVTATTTTNPKGHTETVEYLTATGETWKTTDTNGMVTEHEFDTLGRVTATWAPNRDRATQSPSSRFSYRMRNDGPSVVTTEVLGPRGTYIATKTLYDGLLRRRQLQARAVGGGRLLTDSRYDSQGRAHVTTQPYFNEAAIDDELWSAAENEVPALTKVTFDGAGRQIAETLYGNGNPKWTTKTEHGGDRTTVIPPAGGTTTTALTDARGRTVELRQHKSGGFDATKYTYTKAGSLETITDPAGNVWRKHYDLRQRVVREDDPDKGTVTRSYDDAGRVTATTDARGITLTHGYDELDRQRTVHNGQTLLVENTYDTIEGAVGHPATSTRHADGKAYTTVITGYNSLYQPTGAEITLPQTGKKYTSRQAYNVDGSLRGMTYPAIGDLGEETVTYEYDDLGNPLTAVGGPRGGDPISYVSNVQHTRYGEVSLLQLGEPGKRVWVSHFRDDHTRRVTRAIVDVEAADPMRRDTRYDQDPTGNITSIADAVAGDTQCFRYDHVRRLTDAWTPRAGCAADPDTGSLGGPAPYRQSFAYDAAGNRARSTTHATGGDVVRTSTAGGGHRVDSVAVTGGTAERFAYDPAGNTIDRQADGRDQRLDWDAEGRLTKVTEGASATSFSYTADGSRLLREDPGGLTVYLGDQELRVTPSAMTATRYYRHGGQTVAVRTSGKLTWLVPDHQGTSHTSVDAATLAVNHRLQTPFGQERNQATIPGERAFVGGTKDPSIGLMTLGARQYDAANGRFLSVDPILDAKDPQQMHGYSYANNSPVTFSDPTGLRPDNSFAGCPGCYTNGGINPITGRPSTSCLKLGDTCGRDKYGRSKYPCKYMCKTQPRKPSVIGGFKRKPITHPYVELPYCDLCEMTLEEINRSEACLLDWDYDKSRCGQPEPKPKRWKSETNWAEVIRQAKEREAEKELARKSEGATGPTFMGCVGFNAGFVGAEWCRAKDGNGWGTTQSVKYLPLSFGVNAGVKHTPLPMQNEHGASRYSDIGPRTPFSVGVSESLPQGPVTLSGLLDFQSDPKQATKGFGVGLELGSPIAIGWERTTVTRD